MKRLLTYLKRHPLATLFAPLFKMLEASFELFVPLVVAKMIDIGIYQKNAGYLWRMGACLESSDLVLQLPHSILQQNLLFPPDEIYEMIYLPISTPFPLRKLIPLELLL